MVTIESARASLRAMVTADWHWFVVAGVIALRTATLGLSSFPVYQGYGEVLYTQLARNPSLDPTVALLPMRYFPIHASVSLFGESEWAARFPGMVALAACSFMASGIGRHLAGEFGRRWAPVFFVTNPWVLVWFGRALPDAWLITGILATAYFSLRANRQPWLNAPLVGLGVALALAAKPTGVLALPMLILLRRRDAFLIALSSLAAFALGFAWWAGDGDLWKVPNGLFAVISTRHVVEARFADVPQMIFYGWIIGCAAVAWFGWGPANGWSSIRRNGFRWPPDAWWPLAAFGFYAAWDALPGHAYYFLPAAAWASVLAVRWFQRHPRGLPVALCATALFAPIALFDTGALGDERTRIVDALPPGADVAIPPGLSPMFHYYRPDLAYRSASTPANFTITALPEGECELVAASHYGWQALYAYDCRAARQA
jgi:4-amino-4-deoxy-L-arabinose transferase-like glycosyltransferase